MSKMVLYLDRTEQPSDNRTIEFPIYELDFDKLKGFANITYGGSQAGSIGTYMEQNGGFLKDVNPNNVDPCWFTIFTATDSRILQCLSTNVPRQAWMDGSLIRYKISPQVQDEYTVYQLNPDYVEFDRVEGEQPPDDWADNFWYYQETIQSFTYQSVSYQYYAYTPHIPASSGYDQNKTWVKDKDHKLGAKVFTANGYSFGWFWYPYTSGARSKIGSAGSNYQFFAWKSAGDDYIRPGSDSLDPPFVSSGYLDGFTPFTRTSASEKYQMLVGDTSSYYNYTPFFVNFNIGGTPFYGIAITHSDSYGETANPAQITVIAFTPNFWGGSIQPGGPDPGIWGNDGPTSQAQGGTGGFSYVPDNHGDRQGEELGALVTRTNSNMSAFSGGYHKYKMDRQNQAPLTEMMGHLWDPTLWNSWANHSQNPLAAIVSCMILPVNLVSNTAGVAEVIKAADATLSSTAAPKFDDIFKWYHVGDVNIDSYTDSFADFQATNVYIHLPYVGDFKLDTEAIMEGELSVDYVVDMFTADITAWVWTKDKFGNYNYKYEFKGNCGKVMPLAQIVGAGAQRIGAIFQTALEFGLQSTAATNFWMNYHNVEPGGFSTINGPFGRWINAFEATKTTMHETTGDDGFALQQTARAMALSRGINSILGASAAIGQSNAGGGSLTSLINDQCYLTITRPQWSAPDNYRKLFGYPSDIGGTINEKFEGYLSVRSIKLDGLSATDTEKAEITSLMFSGVYVSDNFNPPQ